MNAKELIEGVKSGKIEVVDRTLVDEHFGHRCLFIYNGRYICAENVIPRGECFIKDATGKTIISVDDIVLIWRECFGLNEYGKPISESAMTRKTSVTFENAHTTTCGDEIVFRGIGMGAEGSEIPFTVPLLKENESQYGSIAAIRDILGTPGMIVPGESETFTASPTASVSEEQELCCLPGCGLESIGPLFLHPGGFEKRRIRMPLCDECMRALLDKAFT